MATEPDGYSAEDREVIRLARRGSSAFAAAMANRRSGPSSVRRPIKSRPWCRWPCACSRPAPKTWPPAESLPNERPFDSRQAARPRGQKPGYRPPQGKQQRPPDNRRPKRGPRKGRR